MFIRSSVIAGFLVSLLGAGCAENTETDDASGAATDADEECTTDCSSGTGGEPATPDPGGSDPLATASRPGAPSGDGTANEAAPGSGSQGTADNGAPESSSDDVNPSGGGAPSGSSEASTAGGNSGGPSITDEPDPDPSPSDTPALPTSPDAGGTSPAPDSAAPDASQDMPMGEPEMTPAVDDRPSSARLTAVPVGTTDAELGYWEYLPPDYGDVPVPLLVFTHGAAWQGEGSSESLQELLEVGPPNLISTDAWPNDRPFLVLSPQNPRSGCFDPNDIDGFYRHALSTYNIDTQRIYHTGQSCGAIGAWNYLAEHLDEFVTAAVLISGDGQPAFEQAGCDLGRVAIWGLHNENDESVDSMGTIVPINGLLECDPTPDVKLTIYPGETAHDAWTKTYDLSAGNDIYSWLLEHVHP